MTETRQEGPEAQRPTGAEIGRGEVAIDQPEPWESWETKLCLWSLGTGVVGLVILGLLVNAFIL